MITSKKHSGRALSFPAGLARSAIISISITMVTSAILGWLIEAEMIAWEQVGYGIMVILFLSSFVGALTAASGIKRQKALACMVAGLVYFIILLSATALFFGAQYHAVGVTALMIVAGNGCAMLWELREKGNGRTRIRKVRNR